MKNSNECLQVELSILNDKKRKLFIKLRGDVFLEHGSEVARSKETTERLKDEVNVALGGIEDTQTAQYLMLTSGGL
jgi:hypothetical protein